MNEINYENLLVIGFKFLHHSTSSGYHHLAKYLPCTYLDANELPFGGREIGSIGRKINLALLETNVKLKAPKYKFIHYLYPEDHVLFSMPKNKNTVSVATLHLSTEKFLMRNSKKIIKSFLIEFQKKNFMNVDGIITLSKAHEEELRKILPPSIKICFIPHGINILPISKKYSDKNKKVKIVVIGSNYRNMEEFFKIVETAKKENKNWTFNLIGVSSSWKKRAGNHTNIVVHPYLEEKEYFELIESCHIHLLPLEFATANNALLEAHALGIPSVVSNISGVSDYSLSTTQSYVDIDEAVNIINKIEKMSRIEYEELRNRTLEESEKFHWENISRKIVNFYKELELEKIKTHKGRGDF